MELGHGEVTNTEACIAEIHTHRYLGIAFLLTSSGGPRQEGPRTKHQAKQSRQHSYPLPSRYSEREVESEEMKIGLLHRLNAHNRVRGQPEYGV
jgi:hypothetical protein